MCSILTTNTPTVFCAITDSSVLGIHGPNHDAPDIASTEVISLSENQSPETQSAIFQEIPLLSLTTLQHPHSQTGSLLLLSITAMLVILKNRRR